MYHAPELRIQVRTGIRKGGLEKEVSVDTGQSAIANAGLLNASHVDQLITMNTYSSYFAP
jgi:hypothetical protein